jgi:hypothetical protein
MEPMLAQDWFMPQLCISPSLFILANEYNCYGIFYLFWGKLKLYWVMPNLQVQALIDNTLTRFQASKSPTDLLYQIARRHTGGHYLNLLPKFWQKPNCAELFLDASASFE